MVRNTTKCSLHAPGRPSAPAMPDPIPARISDAGRTATWNPALTRAAHVVLRVRAADGAAEERRSMNSGRARVRDGETIEEVRPAEDGRE